MSAGKTSRNECWLPSRSENYVERRWLMEVVKEVQNFFI